MRQSVNRSQPVGHVTLDGDALRLGDGTGPAAWAAA
jgi:hypothetical protein